MRRIAAMLLAVTTALLTTALLTTASAGLRCDGSLVSVGDRRFDVRAACGEPDLRVPVRQLLVGAHIALPYEEIWYYNFGPRRFLRELHFQSSRLVAVRTPGYGFHRNAPGGCSPRDLRRGMTLLELHARCGAPDDRELRVRWRHHFPAGLGHVALEEEWLYNFGPRQFYRIVTLVDGRITRVETGGHGH
jgi:hypothetical protein